MPEKTVLYEQPSAIAIGAAVGAADVTGVAARAYETGNATAQRAMSAGATRKPERRKAKEKMIALPFRERTTNRTLSKMVSPGVDIKGGTSRDAPMHVAARLLPCIHALLKRG